MDAKIETLVAEKIGGNDSREISSSNSIDYTEAQGFDLAATKKLIRKLDWHLIPFLSLIYLYVISPSAEPASVIVEMIEILNTDLLTQIMFLGPHQHWKCPVG
jgi:hypothetical protein